MPDHPSWLERVPHILDRLEDPQAPPLLDRSTVESLFQVRRRQAINLMRRFGGYQVGRTFLVPTEEVIHFLEGEHLKADIRAVGKQKQRVADFLGEARLALSLPRIPITPKQKHSEIAFKDLPSGIHISPSRLSIDFQGVSDLLQKLFSLSQALANDFETFETALEGEIGESNA